MSQETPAFTDEEIERIKDAARTRAAFMLQEAGVCVEDAALLSRMLHGRFFPKSKESLSSRSNVASVEGVVDAIDRGRRNLWNGYAIARDLGLGRCDNFSRGPCRSDPAAKAAFPMNAKEEAVGGFAGPFHAQPEGTRGKTYAETGELGRIRYQALNYAADRIVPVS